MENIKNANNPIKPEELEKVAVEGTKTEQSFEQPMRSQEEQLEGLNDQIRTQKQEITELTRSIEETKTKLSLVRNELGLPPDEEEPPSIVSNKSTLEKLQMEQKELEKQKEEIIPSKEVDEESLEDGESQENKEKKERINQISERQKELTATRIAYDSEEEPRFDKIRNLLRKNLESIPDVSVDILDEFDARTLKTKDLYAQNMIAYQEQESRRQKILESFRLKPDSVTNEELDNIENITSDEFDLVEELKKEADELLDNWERKIDDTPSVDNVSNKTQKIAEQIDSIIESTKSSDASSGESFDEESKLFTVEYVKVLCKKIVSIYNEKALSYTEILGDPIKAIDFLEKANIFRGMLKELDNETELSEDFLKRMKENYGLEDANSPENRFIEQSKGRGR